MKRPARISLTDFTLPNYTRNLNGFPATATTSLTFSPLSNLLLSLLNNTLSPAAAHTASTAVAQLTPNAISYLGAMLSWYI